MGDIHSAIGLFRHVWILSRQCICYSFLIRQKKVDAVLFEIGRDSMKTSKQKDVHKKVYVIMYAAVSKDHGIRRSKD